MTAKELRIRCNDIMEEHCANCSLVLELKKELTSKEVMNYCITQCQAGKLVNQLGRLIEKPKPWTEEELFYLKYNLKIHPIDHIAKRLKRPAKLVRQKAIEIKRGNILV